MDKASKFVESIPDIQTDHGIQEIAIIDRNGFLLSPSVPKTVTQAFGALSALIFRSAEMAAFASGIGGIKRVIIVAKHDILIAGNTEPAEPHMSIAILEHSTESDSTPEETSE